MQFKMLSTRCDPKGRLYLSRRIRAQYGEQFIVLEKPDGLKLLAVPFDPIADLEQLGTEFGDATNGNLKQDIHKQAVSELDP